MTHLRTFAAAPLLAAVALGATGCSLPIERAAPTPTPEVTAEAVPAGTDTSTVAPTEGPAYDLRFVNPSAASCSVVWTPGAELPEDYEWCSDEEGDPVAGVRIGSCEVVTFRGGMFAVPGGKISTSLGEIHLDPRFTDLLTSCKRRPAHHG